MKSQGVAIGFEFGVMSNVDIFWSIAQEAFASLQAELARSRVPKPNREPGYIVRLDPDRREFKDAMITVVFCGMFLDAFLFLALRHRFPEKEALSADRLPHETRLEMLGITDQALLNRVIDFRNSRKSLVHEKAVSFDEIGNGPLYSAPQEAESAIQLMLDVQAQFSAP